jgi:ParB family chromosome partitioning protein
MAGRLSVREVERLVRKYLTDSGELKRTVRSKPPHIVDLEQQLSRQFGTKVTIETSRNNRRGKIIIEFYSLEEFDRIMEAVGMGSEDKL